MAEEFLGHTGALYNVEALRGYQVVLHLPGEKMLNSKSQYDNIQPE